MDVRRKGEKEEAKAVSFFSPASIETAKDWRLASASVHISPENIDEEDHKSCWRLVRMRSCSRILRSRIWSSQRVQDSCRRGPQRAASCRRGSICMSMSDVTFHVRVSWRVYSTYSTRLKIRERLPYRCVRVIVCRGNHASAYRIINPTPRLPTPRAWLQLYYVLRSTA